MMRTILLFMLLVSAVFSISLDEAVWIPNSLIALMIGFLVLLALYLSTYIFESKEMRAMLRDDMMAVAVSLFFIASFVSLSAVLEETFTSMFSPLFGFSGSHFTYAQSVVEDMIDIQTEIMTNILELSVVVGKAATTTGSCTFLGIGSTYAGCSGIQIPASSLNYAIVPIIGGMTLLYSESFLLFLTKGFFFPFILPLGVFLRGFNFTRGAGAFFMAFAVSFYFVFPLSIMLTKGLFDMPFIQKNPSIEKKAYEGFDGMECDPFKIKDTKQTKEFIDLLFGEEGDKTDQEGDEAMNYILYVSFLGGMLLPVVNLMIALISIRSLSSVFGAEVDVSALARIA